LPINTYDETHASDYLDQQRIELAKLRAQKIGSSVIIPGFILPLDDSINLSDALAAPTDIAKGTYTILDDSASQKLWLSFDSDVVDKSGNNNHGTITGTETYVADPGRYNDSRYAKGFSFDGSTQVDIANEAQFDRSNVQEFSITFWAKWSTASIMMLITKMTAAASQGIEIGATATGAIRIRLINTATTNEIDVITSSTYKTDYWRHFTLTKSTASNASGVKLYVDGVSLTLTVTTNNLAATIENNIAVSVAGYNGGTSRFTGSMDDVQWWNVELTAAQVLKLSEGRQISYNASVTQPTFLNLADWAV